jgi:hypothetical protein
MALGLPKTDPEQNHNPAQEQPISAPSSTDQTLVCAGSVASKGTTKSLVTAPSQSRSHRDIIRR